VRRFGPFGKQHREKESGYITSPRRSSRKTLHPTSCKMSSNDIDTPHSEKLAPIEKFSMQLTDEATKAAQLTDEPADQAPADPNTPQYLPNGRLAIFAMSMGVLWASHVGSQQFLFAQSLEPS